ncbi:MAG: FAD-dependent oxidoreductase [Lachnospiraceae bacterium]|nr:FAD-dependent oxidoreductase [Lachnospiraceae bacterium]
MDGKHKVWNVGVVDFGLRMFQGQSYAGNGMAWSSYLVQAGETFALIGTVPDAYTGYWIENIARIAPLDRIERVIVFTSENSRASIQQILQKNSQMEVIAAYPVMYQLKKFLPAHTRSVEIRSSRSLLLSGDSFQFRMIGDKKFCPELFVLDQADHCVYTATMFGSLYSGLELPETGSERDIQWEQGMKDFCDNICFAGRLEQQKNAVAFVREQNAAAICPAAGPVVTGGHLKRMLDYYQRQDRRDAEHPNVAIVYEGINELIDFAGQVEKGLREALVMNITSYNLSAEDRNQVIRGMQSADVLLFGTTISGGNPSKAIWDILTSLRPEDCKGKLASVFYKLSTIQDNADVLLAHLNFLGFDTSVQDSFFTGELTENDLTNAGNYGFGVGCSARKVPNPRQPKLVKCLVCGEIFDASLGTCPVCGVGLDQCVPVEEEETGYRRDSELQYVILGGGTAGVCAAEAIRKRDRTGSILIVSAEEYLPINRPMLTKNLDIAEASPEELYIHPAEWFEEKGIRLKLGESAEAVDPERKIVRTSKEAIPYDRLIFATGAECFIPPFGGWEKEGVVTIRHLGDSRKIRNRIPKAKNAVVIGGGVLGLEAANELLRNGIHVTVLEAAPQIIGRQADADSAAVLRKKMAGLGVACLEGVQIEGILGEDQAAGVQLKTGETFPADFVIVSCGNRANIQAAREAGVRTDRAIVVNQFMETNLPDIYACGDCAQYDGVNYQLWAEASDQGRTAGANAAGEKVAYQSQIFGLNLEGFGTTLFAIGDPGKQSEIPCHLVRVTDEVSKSQEQYWFAGGSLQGAVIIGRPDKTTAVTQAVKEHARHGELF